MKKFIFLIAISLISVISYGQMKPVFSVATDSTAFGKVITINSLIYDYGANKLYRVDTLGNMSSTIKSLGLSVVGTWITVDSSTIWQEITNYISLGDTTDSVAIGKLVPTSKLNVLGNSVFEGDVTVDGGNLTVADTLKLSTKPLGISDSILIIDNGIVKYKITSDVTDVTYSELLTKITDSTLKVGWLYRITDFAQAYNIFDGGTNTVIEEQIGATEPLIVYALSTKKLERVAYSPNYPNDIIYYEPTGVNVTTDIGYSDGSGALVADFKGVIEFRHDTKQNVSTWYDFRNIKFRRWAVDCAAYDAGTAYTAKDVLKGSDGKIYKCISDVIAGQGEPSTNTVNWILWWDITADAYISWTSDITKFNIGDITTTNLIFVPATFQDVYTFGSWYQHVNNVTIGKNDLVIVMAYGYNSALNNIVFKTIDDAYTCSSNEIGEISFNNTIGSGFGSNTIGSGFDFNTIGNNFSSNTIGSGFKSNSIESDFNSNTIGSNFNSNTIENGFGSNTIESNFNSNTIENGFGSNTIESGFDFNTIESGFYFNTIGNNSKVSAGINCQGNSIGDYNTQVTLGDLCTGISIGEKNDAITLGNTCTNLVFQNGCTFNTNTAETGLQNCLFESGTSITEVDFTSSTYIKATYNKRVFTNASSVVRLSYFNAADTLTVVNVND